MIDFLYPAAWLLLAGAAAFQLLAPVPAGRQRFWLNGFALLVILALSGPGLTRATRPGTLAVVCDRSRSMPADSDRNHAETVKLLDASRPARAATAAVIAFAGGAAVERAPGGDWNGQFQQPLERDRSELDTAIDTALQRMEPGTPGRILVLSDGRWTGRHPRGKFAAAAARGVPVDFRTRSRVRTPEPAIRRVAHPWSVEPGEGYTLELELDTPAAGRGLLEIRRRGEIWKRGAVELAPGVNFLTFRDRSDRAGVIDYDIRFTGPPGTAPDPCPENNRARTLVRIAGARPVLLCTLAADSGLGALLRQAKIPVETRTPERFDFTPEALAGYAGVVLENLPAARIGNSGMAQLAAMVEAGELGLVITGGKNAFGLGGYFQSPLEKVLPVSLEQKNEHRKGTVALAVALDRSGSMAASVGGHRTKMDLANLGAAEALKMLGPGDRAAVYAVDSSVHEILPLQDAVSAQRQLDSVLSIASMGGGIFVYNALEAAAGALLKANTSARHIILFADAADAEQPGKYRELLAECRKAGITVSAIGLGGEKDCDAELLRDIARRGEGQVYFTANPDELPRVFAQDALTVTRNLFVEEPAPVEWTGAARLLRPGGFSGECTVGGYNLCFLKDRATAAAQTADENRSPLAAFMEIGLGRCAVFAAEAAGKFSGAFSSWPERGALLTGLVQYAIRADQPLPPGTLVTQELENGVHRIVLSLDPERRRDPFRSIPAILTLERGADGRTVPRRRVMEYRDPDTLELDSRLSGDTPEVAALELDNRRRPWLLAPVRQPYSAEFQPAGAPGAGDSLAALAALSGGRERLELAGIWADLENAPGRLDLTGWVLLASVLWLLLAVADRRFDWLDFRRIPKITLPAAVPRFRRRRRPPEPIPPRRTASPAAPQIPDTAETGVMAALKNVKKHKKL